MANLFNNRKDNIPLNERIKFNVLKRKYYCSMCGEEMILRHHSLGMFWQCPYCGNAVITPVAKEVAEEEIKRQGKEKEIKVCPNCGDVLDRKGIAEDSYLECPNRYICGSKLIKG